MRIHQFLSFTGLAIPLAACAHPNVKPASSYASIPSPPVKHSNYDPYAAYGEANATWQPPVFDRNGTIVSPTEPSSQAGRPDYEHSEWATGAAGGNQFKPTGTF